MLRFGGLLAALTLTMLVAGCPGGTDRGAVTEGARTPATGAATGTAQPGVRVQRVVAVSVDGLHADALERLGRERAPHLWRLVDQGASTFNARAGLELTLTLPNHTSMLTGRRMDPNQGGHGILVNSDPGGKISDHAGEPVVSVFDAVEATGGESALFASKPKFALFDRSWPAIDHFVMEDDNVLLAKLAAEDVRSQRRAFTFVHLSLPDQAGHDQGWMGTAYLEAVEDTDALVGDLVAAAGPDALFVVTSDHGGEGTGHALVTDPDVYTVPFILAGSCVPPGVDLYELDPTRVDPGTGRPDYAGAPPVIRNADLANLVASALGGSTVPGSEIGAEEPLRPCG